jgi:hypothetical protein
MRDLDKTMTANQQALVAQRKVIIRADKEDTGLYVGHRPDDPHHTHSAITPRKLLEAMNLERVW